MKKIFAVAAIVTMITVFSASWAVAPAQADPHPSCWGQASKVFAKMGMMGEHSSSQSNPRAGLRNLARLLADAGVIPDDSMASLGAFVANELMLSIDACQ